MSKGLFITGTGTDVGKTYITGLILKKLREGGVRPAYYKAAMSGNERGKDGGLIPGDALRVKEASGIEQPLSEMCPYVYENAVSPHLASRMEGGPVRMERVMDGFRAVCDKYDYVTMEGSGGILCPLGFDEGELYLPDVVKALGLPCLMIADAGLGTINGVALTAFYMKAQGIPLKGIIFNRYIPGDAMREDNLKMCEHLTGAKVIAYVQDGEAELGVSPEALMALYE